MHGKGKIKDFLAKPIVGDELTRKNGEPGKQSVTPTFQSGGSYIPATMKFRRISNWGFSFLFLHSGCLVRVKNSWVKS